MFEGSNTCSGGPTLACGEARSAGFHAVTRSGRHADGFSYSEQVSTSTAPRGSRRKPPLLIAGLVVVVFAILVLVAQQTPQRPQAEASPPPSTTATSTASASPQRAELSIVRRDAKDPAAIGDVNAPVVLLLWTDLRCPFCALFDRDTLPTIVRDYVQTGKVRIEVHPVAFFGEQSGDAAVAAQAAGEQGKFFAFLNAVYAEAPEKGHPELPRQRLIYFAKKAGVPDIKQFTADLGRSDLRQAAQQSTQGAQSLGVNSVPFFVVGNTAVAGAQPIEVFRRFLDDAIEQAA
ncbi:MAG: thioredoxin domain-containing protein [Micropruina sp.]|uniref:DsbA family protein n=1 Tax=Micropruina sp. TaxID=2737536 RepID=UPI0039E45546